MSFQDWFALVVCQAKEAAISSIHRSATHFPFGLGLLWARNPVGLAILLGKRAFSAIFLYGECLSILSRNTRRMYSLIVQQIRASWASKKDGSAKDQGIQRKPYFFSISSLRFFSSSICLLVPLGSALELELASTHLSASLEPL